MNGHLNILDLVLQASLPVKLVLLLLLAFSFLSWVIIVRKFGTLKQAIESADQFEERFWSGADLAGLFREVGRRGDDADGLESVFEAGFREFARQRQRKNGAGNAMDSTERAMRVTSVREVEKLEHNMEFLANVGSISPYIGLFGTVWGIMAAFQGLGAVKQATIAMVAPGISEALVATAMGLFAAIPAVWAYNRYATKVDRIATRYDNFQEEFSSILERQVNADDNA
ncbi:MAG TPA: protein TolQ [Oleiagrimonas sp.]|nr:protein TolQ [Oleiagrimonas sp.]